MSYERRTRIRAGPPLPSANRGTPTTTSAPIGGTSVRFARFSIPYRPLGSQAMLFFDPVLRSIFGGGSIAMQRVMSEDGGIDRRPPASRATVPDGRILGVGEKGAGRALRPVGVLPESAQPGSGGSRPAARAGSA